MELTQEQFNQAARYVDGEMNTGEKQAFEAILLQNSRLLEEVEAYREIRLLGESIDAKVNDSDQQLTQKKIENEYVWKMLQHERQHWESRYEAHLRSEPDEEGTITFVDENNNTRGRVKRMKPGAWLAVASVTALVILGAVWWYLPVSKNKPQVSQSQNNPGAGSVAARPDTPKIVLPPGVPAPKMDSSLVTGTTEVAKLKEDRKKKQRITGAQLFQQNFVRDSLPVQLPGLLASASFDYHSGKHKEAIAGYRKILTGAQTPGDAPATRGINGEEELASFYARYYLGQSLISVNRTTEGARELETAMKESPNLYWSSKTAWYLALATLKTGNEQKTMELLKQVIRQDPSGIYAGKATQLARKLGRK